MGLLSVEIPPRRCPRSKQHVADVYNRFAPRIPNRVPQARQRPFPKSLRPGTIWCRRSGSHLSISRGEKKGGRGGVSMRKWTLKVTSRRNFFYRENRTSPRLIERIRRKRQPGARETFCKKKKKKIAIRIRWTSSAACSGA